MKKAACSIVLVLLPAGAFMAGSWHNQRTADAKNATSARRVLYYMCPMHPQHKSDKPGNAPCCGMRLEPVYADGGAAAPAVDAGSAQQPPEVLKIGFEKQQLMGVRVSPVEDAAGTTTVRRLFGRVAADETATYKLTAGVEGWIVDAAPVTTGSQVEKGQLLATFSTPDLFLSVQAYLFALTGMDHLGNSAASNPTTSNMKQRVERLESLGMSPAQIEEIRLTRQFPPSIKILAPASGFVLARNVSPGQRFEKGMEWYRIADLKRVWILADVVGNDAQYFHPGVRAVVTLPDQGKTLVARVSEVLPQFDTATRTMKVRLEVDNRGYILRPDMFVDVELQITLPRGVTVPVDAVLDSGLKKTVFVDRGEGSFEPREVETGWRFGGHVQVVKGLEPGERVVTAGNFLLDSETRMKAVAADTQGSRQISKLDSLTKR
jgi:membrane fusion protein, copper/silver efflux system